MYYSLGQVILLLSCLSLLYDTYLVVGMNMMRYTFANMRIENCSTSVSVNYSLHLDLVLKLKNYKMCIDLYFLPIAYS